MGLLFTFAFMYAYDPDEYRISQFNIKTMEIKKFRVIKLMDPEKKHLEINKLN